MISPFFSMSTPCCEQPKPMQSSFPYFWDSDVYVRLDWLDTVFMVPLFRYPNSWYACWSPYASTLPLDGKTSEHPIVHPKVLSPVSRIFTWKKCTFLTIGSSICSDDDDPMRPSFSQKFSRKFSKIYRVVNYTCRAFAEVFCRQNRIKRAIKFVFWSIPCGAIRLPKF